MCVSERDTDRQMDKEIQRERVKFYALCTKQNAAFLQIDFCSKELTYVISSKIPPDDSELKFWMESQLDSNYSSINHEFNLLTLS